MASKEVILKFLAAIIFFAVFTAVASAVPLYADNITIGDDSIKIEVQKKNLKPNISTTVRKGANDKIVITIPSVKLYDKAISKNLGDTKEEIIRFISIKNVRKNKKDTAQISIDVKNLKFIDIKTSNSLSKTIITISSLNAPAADDTDKLLLSKVSSADMEESHGEVPAAILSGVALADDAPAKIASLKIALGQIRILADKKIEYKVESSSGEGIIILSNVTGFLKPRVQDVNDDTFDKVELTPLPDNKLSMRIHPVQPETIYAFEVNDNSNELRVIAYLPVRLNNLKIIDEGTNKKVVMNTKDPIYNYKILNRDSLKSLTFSIPNGRLGSKKLIEGQSEDISYKLVEQDNKLNVTISFANKYIVMERIIDGNKLEFDLIRAKGEGGKHIHTVAIDPGHGGNDPGADGDYSHEKDINLSVSAKLKEILSKKYNVVMTRMDDKNLALDERIDLINSNKPDISISIHCNSSPKTSMKGFETYYFAPPSSNLANIMHLSLQQNMSLDDKGVKKQPFALIKYISAPAILIEMEYISNSGGEAFLNDPANQDAYAKAIADGVDKYFSRIGSK